MELSSVYSSTRTWIMLKIVCFVIVMNITLVGVNFLLHIYNKVTTLEINKCCDVATVDCAIYCYSS